MPLAPGDVTLLTAFGAALLAAAAAVACLRDPSSAAARAARPRWLSARAPKAWAEAFFLRYSVVWISWFGAVVVSGAWRSFGPWAYLAVGAGMAAPCALAPLALEPAALEPPGTPLGARYWVKANLWIALFSYVGNYFWTHYFTLLLGARYTFTAHRLNDVPVSMFLATHAYFCTYHAGTTVLLRRWRTSATAASLPRAARAAGTAGLVAALAVATAFTEAFTIQGFPYYHIPDRTYMYSVGSMVYGLYFVVSFPMFARLDEPDDDEEADGGGGGGGAVTGGGGAGARGGARGAADDDGAAAGRGKTPAKALAAPLGRRGSVADAPSTARARAGAGAGARAGAGASPLAPRRASRSPAPAAAAAAARPPAARAARLWSLGDTARDALAAGMAVTILLDLWRLGYTKLVRGVDAPGALPWVPA